MLSANSETPVVIGIGEILWDNLPSGRRLGGAPTNFAYHVHALGVPATVVTRIGDDPDGHEILSRVGALDLSTEFVQMDRSHPTGVVQVALDRDGTAIYTIRTGVAWDFLEWSESLDALANSISAVCFGTLGQRAQLSRTTIQRFVAATPTDCLRVCDINLRQHYYDADLLRQSLRLANVLKLNHEELPIVLELIGVDREDTEAAHRLRAAFDLTLVALTRGASGSILVSETESCEHPGVDIDLVDTVGAGDSFTAALVVGLLRGDSLPEINEAANVLAARVCGHAGAIPV